MKNQEKSYEQMIRTIILFHFGYIPKFIKRITIGTSNEVYDVGLKDKEVIVRLSPVDKFLMGSHDHIPKFKNLDICVPTILFENYNKKLVPVAYQIQNKIAGQDMCNVIEDMTDDQLRSLAREIVNIFNKIKTIPSSDKFGVIWGGGDNDISDSWTERMRIWIDDSKENGTKTGVIDENILRIAENLYVKYRAYFDSVKPITYYGDISYKNIMVNNGAFSGLVDLDGLTQGDLLEAIGRIKLSWYKTPYDHIYTNAIMDEMNLNNEQRNIVIMYALLNQISWTCHNGIQFNQNTQSVVDRKKEIKDKEIIKELAFELQLI